MSNEKWVNVLYTRREHLVERKWEGAGTYQCRCGASIEAINEEVLRWIFLDHCVREGQKQARAEVLVAVLAKMDGPKMNHADLYRAIQELQPAAKHLEELLREAELKAVKSSPECWHYTSETEQEFMERYFAWHKKNLAELEKARAIE